MRKLVLCFLLALAIAFSQGNTGLLSGVVTDPTGAAVPAAEVSVANVETGQIVKTTTNEKGEYSLPSMPPGNYRVTVAKSGFKTETKAGVEMAAGVATTANVKLELGQTSETVVVQGGAEIVQATSAEVSSTITGRQITELPTATRNGMELFTMLPGVQTTTSYRTSSVNGMPFESTNVTIDGMNTNDNWLKSQDGFFSYIMPSVDSLEEVTLSSSAGGVDSTAQGGAQLKFVTRSGTNQYHGGVVWQTRNTFFDANYYFNTINRLPRDIIKWNQGGAHVGGPIKKDKLFFFVNYEIYRLPSSSTFSRTILPPTGWNGDFKYKESNGTINTVNLFNLAQQANAGLPSNVRPFRTNIDPTTNQTLGQIWALVQNGNLQNNIPTNDYNRDTYRYGVGSSQSRTFVTSRLDYNLTEKHHLSFVWNWDKYLGTPDILNSVVPVYAGTGTVLGNPTEAGQNSYRFEGTLTLRSSLSARMTNELRLGASGGTVLFYDAVGNDALYNEWKGFVPSFGYFGPVTTTTGVSRRNAPLKDVSETVSYVKGGHQLSFGGTFTNVATWQQSIGSETLPGMSFGIAAGDPAITGNTAWFTTANFPGITSSDLSSAESMYAALTGRVSSISQQVVENEKTHQYAHAPAIDRNHQREFGWFLQDTWRVSPNLTLTLGGRVEYQLPFVNVNQTYTTVGLAGIWGVSGIGHMFQPGVLTGTAPVFNAINGKNAYSEPAVFLPSIGFAYQLKGADNPFLRFFVGRHTGAGVLRGGYAISSLRPGGYNFQGIWGSNKGLYYSTSVDPNNFPQYFGPAGGVWLADSSFPAQPNPAAPQFPISPSFTDSVNDFDPNLKMGYVQSWNIGFQRELTRDTVMEVRYTGNHGVHEWRQVNLNEVNIFENGFLNEAEIAMNNLAIANNVSLAQLPYTASLKSNNYGNQGLPGQQNLKILPTALGTTCCNDSTTATYLAQNRIGTLANSIATNLTRLNAMIAAGYPSNFFQVNPTVGSGGAYLMTNWGSTYYDSLQVEVRRRLSHGLSVQGSYVWAHSLADGALNNSSDYNAPTTFRNLRLDRIPSGFDIRQAYKANWIYEFPLGPGRAFFGSVRNGFVRKALEGWEFAGTTRIQAGTPSMLSAARGYINAGTAEGVVLHNITISQLQKEVGVYKTTGSNGIGIIYDLPTSIIQNSEAAFNQGGFTLDPNAPYIGPQTAPGALGYDYFLRGPWQKHLDVSIVKRTRIKERFALETRAQALDVLNVTNFYLGSASVNGTTFGQITSAFRDTSNANDPGARILEFVVRVTF